MGKLEVIEQEVATLSAAELSQFRDWFAQFDNAVWDRQFDEDAATGKLDNLALQALSARGVSKSKPLRNI